MPFDAKRVAKICPILVCISLNACNQRKFNSNQYETNASSTLSQESSRAAAMEAERNALSAQRQKSDALTELIRNLSQQMQELQVIQRSGRGSPLTYSCLNNGCRNEVVGNLPLFNKKVGIPVGFPFPKISNKDGEWSSTINVFPSLWGDAEGESAVEIPDSNVFVTANAIVPLYLLQISNNSRPFFDSMMRSAISDIRTYARGKAFSFWPQHTSTHGSFTVVGPLNIPLKVANLQKLFTWIPQGPNTPPAKAATIKWLKDALDPGVNPTLEEGLVNIPNDSDDSAVSAAALLLAYKRGYLTPAEAQDIYTQAVTALSELDKFKDEGRNKEDGRDSWKPHNSGAYLTWLRSEDKSAFADPNLGFIPSNVNNVDCVVNANALFAKGLLATLQENSNTEAAVSARAAAVAAITLAVQKQAWPNCGLYYPQQMIFPYTASRAYREGNIPELKPAMQLLLKQLIATQKNYANQNPALAGAFPGCVDKTFDLSTSLGLVTLLNIGKPLATELALDADYDAAVTSALSFIQGRAAHNAQNLESGVFFSASSWNLAQWRSKPYTVAIVLEGIAKYLAAYDVGIGNIATGLHINEP